MFASGHQGRTPQPKLAMYLSLPYFAWFGSFMIMVTFADIYASEEQTRKRVQVINRVAAPIQGRHRHSAPTKLSRFDVLAIKKVNIACVPAPFRI
jgi:hypothetical protein